MNAPRQARERMHLTPFYEDAKTFTASVEDGYRKFGDAIEAQGLKAK